MCRDFLFQAEHDAVATDRRPGTEWDFTGTALSGTLTGKQLAKITVLKNYWFDWKAYNPKTTVYTLGDK